MSANPVVPVPSRRVTTVRNMRRVRLGIGLAAAALVLVVVGALVQWGSLSSQVLRPTARGDIGETVSFDAGAQRYDLILVRSDAEAVDFVERTVARTVCEITLADGTTATVRGSRQAISSENGLGSTIGWFDAVAGPTTVVCDHNQTQGFLIGGYTVAESHQRLTVISLGGIVLGLLAGIAGAMLIANGLRGKAVMVDV